VQVLLFNIVGAACIIVGLVLALRRTKGKVPGFLLLLCGILLLVLANHDLAGNMTQFKLGPTGIEVSFSEVKATQIYTPDQLDKKASQARTTLFSGLKAGQAGTLGVGASTLAVSGTAAANFSLFNYVKEQGCKEAGWEHT
jgi:hypothetical protein